MKPDHKEVTLRRAAEIIGLSESSTRRLLVNAGIEARPALKTGRPLLFPLVEVERIAAQRKADLQAVAA